MNVRKKFSLKNRLYLLLLICVIPLTVMITYLLFMINNVSSKYDHIVEKITKANAYNIGFKEDIDYVMYIIVVNSERAEELVDTQKPQKMIKEAREVFGELAEDADSAYAKQRLSRILKSLDTLEKRVQEIEEDALVSGSYETNMESLDLNIRVLTELIQEQIQYYIYYESMNMEDLRGGIRNDVEQAIAITSGILLVILVGAFAVSRKIVTGITEPIGELCDAAVAAGGGDFRIRAVKTGPEEIEVLNKSFNQMVEKIGNLVEDIHTEELNLRAAELRVLQEQINPHFLYNTLSMMNWMAIRSNQMEISKVTLALSTFYRTALSKGEDVVTVENCIQNMEAYLEIQLTMHDHNFSVDWDIDPTIKNEKMPKLLLQPVVENAIEHGLDEKEDGDKKIFLSFKGKGDDVEITVRDNGLGMEQEKAETLVTYQAKGYGLKNVNDRIRLLYGENYGIHIFSSPDEGTTVIMKFPKEGRENEE